MTSYFKGDVIFWGGRGGQFEFLGVFNKRSLTSFCQYCMCNIYLSDCGWKHSIFGAKRQFSLMQMLSV